MTDDTESNRYYDNHDLVLKRIRDGTLDNNDFWFIDRWGHAEFKLILQELQKYPRNVTSVYLSWGWRDGEHRKRSSQDFVELFAVLEDLPNLDTIFLDWFIEQDDDVVKIVSNFLNNNSNITRIRIAAEDVPQDLIKILSLMPSLEELKLYLIEQTSSLLPLLDSRTLSKLLVNNIDQNRISHLATSKELLQEGLQRPTIIAPIQSFSLFAPTYFFEDVASDIVDLIQRNSTIKTLRFLPTFGRIIEPPSEKFLTDLAVAVSKNASLQHLQLPFNGTYACDACKPSTKKAFLDGFENNYTLLYFSMMGWDPSVTPVASKVNYFLRLNAYGRRKLFCSTASQNDWVKSLALEGGENRRIHWNNKAKDTLDWIYYVLCNNPTLLCSGSSQTSSTSFKTIG